MDFWKGYAQFDPLSQLRMCQSSNQKYFLTTAWTLGTFANFQVSLIFRLRALFPAVLWRVTRSPPRALSLAAGPIAVVPSLPSLPLEVPYVKEVKTT